MKPAAAGPAPAGRVRIADERAERVRAGQAPGAEREPERRRQAEQRGARRDGAVGAWARVAALQPPDHAARGQGQRDERPERQAGAAIGRGPGDERQQRMQARGRAA